MVLSIVAGLFLSLIPIGILFKLMYWPGATIYLLIGLVVTPILMLLSYFLRAKAPEHLYRYYTNMLIRSSIWGVLVFVLYFTSSATLLRIQYWHDPELARLKALHYTYPDNKAYTHQHDAYIQKKDSLR